jgi:hypothetical protein
MTREDGLWLAIRIFGIYFLMKALLALPRLVTGVGGILAIFAAYGASDIELEMKTLFEAFRGVSFFIGLLELIIFTPLGIYFLRGAPRVVRFIRQNDGTQSDT